MPGTMAVVESMSPEELARESIQSEAGGAFGENGHVEGDHTFENEGVGFPLHV